MNEYLKIEPAFDSFVKSIGGLVLKNEISASPTFENADYVLHGQQIVVELKCLEDDKLNDAKYMGKIDEAWGRWRRDGLVDRDTPEAILLNELPAECARELVSIASTPLKGVIKKANRQIRGTKEALGLQNYKGLLLLANDGNFALPANTMSQLVGGVLSGGYTSINCFVIFSVNMVAQVPGADIPCMVWMPSYRSEAESIAPDVMRFLRDEWCKFHERITGRTYRRFGDDT